MHFSLAKIRTLLLCEKRAPGGRGGRARHFGTKWHQVRFYKHFVHFHTVNRKSLRIERRATLTTEVAHLERRRNEMFSASGIVLFGGACHFGVSCALQNSFLPTIIIISLFLYLSIGFLKIFIFFKLLPSVSNRQYYCYS